MPKRKTTKTRMPRRRSSVRRSRGDQIPESFLYHLFRNLPGFKRLPPLARRDFAYLIWIEGTWRREHSVLPGYMTIHYRELMQRFGRGVFASINAALGAFEVTNQWHKPDGATKGSTKGYRLTPAVAKIKNDYLHKGHRHLTRLIQDDGRRMRTIPEAIAAKDQQGRTQTVWRNASVVKRIPVDLPRLQLLYDRLENLHRGRGTGDLFMPEVTVEDVRWHYDTLGQFLRLCKTDVAGVGHVPIRYSVAKTGRLFAEGISLQTLPKAIRNTALHSLWNYDIENCHFAIFHQLAAQYGLEAEAIAGYLRDKTATRNGIADRVGITVPQVKVCLLAIMYGARDTTWRDAAIPQAIGADAAQRLFVDQVFAAILADIKQGRKVILASYPRRRTTMLNAVDLPIRLDAPAEERLAHLVQGIEAKALRAVQAEYPEDLLLLMHDGWVSRNRLDVARMEAVMLDATGYELRLSEDQITLPPDLDLSILR